EILGNQCLLPGTTKGKLLFCTVLLIPLDIAGESLGYCKPNDQWIRDPPTSRKNPNHDNNPFPSSFPHFPISQSFPPPPLQPSSLTPRFGIFGYPGSPPHNHPSFFYVPKPFDYTHFRKEPCLMLADFAKLCPKRQSLLALFSLTKQFQSPEGLWPFGFSPPVD